MTARNIRTRRLVRRTRFGGALALAAVASALGALLVAEGAHAFSVTVQIQGAGTISGEGINCTSPLATPSFALGQGGDCTQDYGSFHLPVTVDAATLGGSAAFGWSFAGWSCPNPPVGASCTFGNIFDPAAYTIRARFADNAAPSITITAGPQPGEVTESTGAVFGLSSNDPQASFRCSLDQPGPPLAACSATASYTGLAPGVHTFRALAVDPSRNASPTVERTWTVAGPKCLVPRLRGKTLAGARVALTARKCALGNVSRAFSQVRKGRIVRQAPAAGAIKPAGAKVNVVVSRGRRP